MSESDRPQLRAAIAAEFQRLDAHEWGYDHGFCADPDADPETASFVDAAVAVVQPLLDAKDTELHRYRLAYRSARRRAAKASGQLDGITSNLSVAREAAKQRADMLEEARDLFTSAGINRAHGDDWPDIIPALRELIEQRDRLAAAVPREP